MHRRSGIRRAARGGGGAVWTPASVPAALQGFWYRELVTLTGPDVATWVDKLPSGHGDAAPTVGYGNPLWNNPDTNYTHQRSLGFDEANVEHMVVPGTLASQKWMHDGVGAGMCMGFTFRATKTADATMNLCGSTDESGAVGSSVKHDTSSDRVGFRVHNGTSLIVDATTANGSAPVNTTHSIVVAFRNHATLDDWEIWFDGALVASGTASGAPSTSDAGSAMRIGARGNIISWYYVGTIGEAVGLKDFSLAGLLAAHLRKGHP